MTTYSCPYCNNTKPLWKSWASIKSHIISCNKNTGEYFIDSNEGPIHYINFIGIRPDIMKEKIKINKELDRKLLIVLSSYINKFNTLEEMINE